MIKVRNTVEAWKKVDELFPTDYARDEKSSKNAGYNIYRSTAEGSNFYNYICDLGDRLEINLVEGNKTINVWIEEDETEEGHVEVEVTAKRSGNTKQFKSYVEFISEFRFWMSSGVACKDAESNESFFNRTIAAVCELGSHGAAIEVNRSGMLIKFIYFRFNDLDRDMKRRDA
jgi:hypothetical protein